MRKFALYRDLPDFDDHLGNCLPLNGPHVYMVGPSGLGMNIDPQNTSFDNFFYKTIKKSSFEPEQVSGTVIFYDENNPKLVYNYYRQFVSFCLHAKKLYFGYTPLGSDDPTEIQTLSAVYSGENITIYSTSDDAVSFIDDGIYISSGLPDIEYESKLYKADTEFISIDKTEIDTYNVLQCPVQFKLLTPWYSDILYRPSVERPHDYGTISNINDIIIRQVNGDIAASFKFEIEGVADSLSFGIKNHDTGDILWTIDLPFYTLLGFPYGAYNHNIIFKYSSEYSGCDIHLSIKKTSENEYVDYNLIDYIDITDNIFYRIPVGVTPVFFARLAGTSVSYPDFNVAITTLDYYRGV